MLDESIIFIFTCFVPTVEKSVIESFFTALYLLSAKVTNVLSLGAGSPTFIVCVVGAAIFIKTQSSIKLPAGLSEAVVFQKG